MHSMAMRHADPGDCVNEWWTSNLKHDSSEALDARIRDWLLMVEYCPTPGAIISVGHSLYFKRFLDKYVLRRCPGDGLITDVRHCASTSLPG